MIKKVLKLGVVRGCLIVFMFLCTEFVQAQQVDFLTNWEARWGPHGGPEPAGLDTATLPIAPNRFGSVCLGDLDGDGDMDFVSGSNRGILFYFENIGTSTDPEWVRTSHATLDTIHLGIAQNTNELRPELVDIDSDGDLDLLVGSRWNYAGFHKLDDNHFYRNIGSDTLAIFQYDTIPGLLNQQNCEFSGYAFADLDNDDDLDLVAGGSDSATFYLNIGTKFNPIYERKFGAENPFDQVDGSGSNWVEASFLLPTPDLEDVDGDGDYDLLFMNEAGFIRYIPNHGTADSLNFSPLVSYPVPSLDTVDFGAFGSMDMEDVTGDGVKDLLATHWNPTTFYWYEGFSLGASANITIDSTVSCNGASDGGLTVTVTGESSYTYLWSNGATTASITGLSAGTYTVYYTDTIAVTDSVSITLTEPTALTASVVIDSNASCNGAFDGGATVSVTGGTPPYSYSWNNTATTASITGVTAGTYTVTITDANGCTTSDSGTITEPAGFSALVTIDSNATCNGFANGGATASATGGTPPYTYAWSNSATTASITGVLAGTYTVTITDANGCSASNSGTVTEPTALTASSIVDSNAACNGFANGGATASATGGTPPYTYAWSNSATTASITGVTAGTYTVTITDANGCSDNSSVTVTEPTVMSASVVIDSNATCNGLANGGATASATGGTPPYTYAWSNLATTISITGVLAGTYTVTVTDANGCSASNSGTITEPSALMVSSVVDSNVSCNGFANGGATASATGGTPPYTYAWSNGATTASITGVLAGTYTVTITDANGCSGNTLVTITEPAVSASTDTVIAFGAYEWIDGNTYTETTYGPTHTLTDMNGCDSVVTLDFTLVNYCTLKSTRNRFEWIKELEIGDDIDNLTNKDGDGYGDYTDQILIVDTGDVVTLSLDPGYRRRAYVEYWRIWIDWNYDGDFDDVGEKVFEQKGKYLQTGSFTVPTNVSTHDLRLRVAMRWKRYPSSCGSYRNGEVEEYTIRVNGAQGYSAPSTKAIEEVEIIEEEYEFSELYPNPVSNGDYITGYVRVGEPGVKQFTVVNTLGQIVQTVFIDCSEEESRFEISTKNLSKGIYFISIEGGLETSKVNIQ